MGPNMLGKNSETHTLVGFCVYSRSYLIQSPVVPLTQATYLNVTISLVIILLER